MGLIVQKFGGTSVADTTRIKNVAEKIKKEIEIGNKVVVVVSAMAGQTNNLIDLISGVNPHCYKAETDVVLASGEQISCGLLALSLQKKGVKGRSFLGWQVPIQTDDHHTKARILKIDTGNLIESINQKEVPVVAGFQGVTEKGRITTLGRGGSDTTAVAIAVALKADRCDIYTDVDGVYTCDPRIVANAKKLDTITYEEMFELAAQGAKVLQLRSVEMAMKNKLPLRVLSSFIEGTGTMIVQANQSMECPVVVGLAHDLNQVKMTLTSIPDQTSIISKVFESLAHEKINVDVIVKNVAHDDRSNLTFTISKEDVEKTRDILSNSQSILGFNDLLVDENLAKVSAVGVGMNSNYGVASAMFRTLSDANIPIHLISTSEIKISVLIDADNLDVALNTLHKTYNLGDA